MLEACRVVLEACRAVLEACRVVLEACRAVLGASRVVPEACRGRRVLRADPCSSSFDRTCMMPPEGAPLQSWFVYNASPHG